LHAFPSCTRRRGVCLSRIVVTHARPELGGDDAEEIASAVREIEHYLLVHPHASDTLQGVSDWWLAERGRPLRVEVLQAALDLLVERRILEARAIPGGVVYAGATRRDDE
jgi:hypothetical protein